MAIAGDVTGTGVVGPTTSDVAAAGSGGSGGTSVKIQLTSTRDSVSADSGGSPIYNSTTSNYTYTVVMGTITDPTYFQQEDVGTITLAAGSGVTFIGSSLTTTGEGSIIALIPEVSMPNTYIVSLSSSQTPLVTQDEGVTVSTATSTLNFTGAGVTASGSAGNVTVNIPGGGSSSLITQDEGVTLTSSTAILNFVGAGVTATNAGNDVTVTIPGGGGSLANFTESSNTATPNATVPVSVLEATNAATNVDIAIVTKGTGSFLLDVPDNAVAGGNKRGTNAVDLQMLRTNAAQVASGPNSFAAGFSNSATLSGSVALGGANTSSGTAAFASGGNNTASGAYSTALGRNGTTNNIQGQVVFGHASTTPGQSQTAFTGLRQSTTGTTPTRATADAAAAALTNQLTLRTNSAFKFLGRAVAIDVISGDAKEWEFSGLIKRRANANDTSLVGTPSVTSTFADAAAAAWNISVSADTTNGALAVTVTGAGANTIRWNIEVMSIEAT